MGKASSKRESANGKPPGRSQRRPLLPESDSGRRYYQSLTRAPGWTLVTTNPLAGIPLLECRPKIVGGYAGILQDPEQHAGADRFAVVKGEQHCPAVRMPQKPVTPVGSGYGKAEFLKSP